MKPPINELLLAALMRAGVPLGSDDLVDHAAGLAKTADWPNSVVSTITRKSVSKRLLNMCVTGLVKKAGQKVDAHSRPVDTFVPVDGWNPHAEAPPLPTQTKESAPESLYEGMQPRQLYALLEVQDEVLAEVARHTRNLRDINERARRRLAEVGLGTAR